MNDGGNDGIERKEQVAKVRRHQSGALHPRTKRLERIEDIEHLKARFSERTRLRNMANEGQLKRKECFVARRPWAGVGSNQS